MTIINSGGTFNKIYNPLTGNLDVPSNNIAIEKIISTFTYPLDVEGIIFKDSLEMSEDDREELYQKVDSLEGSVVIVHGTDTMHESALYLHDRVEDRVIVFTGAMVPFSIDPIEATANLAMAINFAKTATKSGIYISMQGEVASLHHLRKNRSEGKFQRV